MRQIEELVREAACLRLGKDGYALVCRPGLRVLARLSPEGSGRASSRPVFGVTSQALRRLVDRLERLG